jgi:hypothetical protein
LVNVWFCVEHLSDSSAGDRKNQKTQETGVARHWKTRSSLERQGYQGQLESAFCRWSTARKKLSTTRWTCSITM